MALACKLDLEGNLSKAFRRLATDQIGKTAEQLEAPPAEREHAIHGARKSLKKLRALVKLARPSLDGAYHDLNETLRDVGRDLSGARDATALIECLDKLEAGFGNRLRRNALADTRRMLSLRRDAVLADGKHLEARIETSVQGLGTARRIARAACWPQSKGDLAADFEGSYRACRKAWKAVCEDAGNEAAHEWRKRTKALSAQLGLLREELNTDMTARRDGLLHLAERLGDHHDLAVLEETVLPDPGVPPEERKLLAGLIEAQRQAIRRQALADGERLLAEKPHRFAKRLRSEFSAAHD